MAYSVFVPVNPCEDQLFEETAFYPTYWNVQSDFNDGYRATLVLWQWFRDHSIECYEWDICYREPIGDDVRGGAVFSFDRLEHARLFKLTWV